MRISFLVKAAILLSITFCLCGCQPTPEAPIIIGRDSLEQSGKLVAATEPAYKMEVPEKVHNEIKLNICSFFVDATIEVSDSELHPVFRIKQKDFSSSDIRKICDTLIPDKLAMRDASKETKEEIEEMIYILKQGIPVKNKDGSVTYTPNDLTEEEWSKYYDALEKAEPEAFQKIATEIDYTPSFKSCFERSDGKKSYFYAYSNYVSVFFNDYGNIQMQSWIAHDGGWEGEGAIVLSPTITREDAKKAADQLLDSLDLSNMSLASTEAARMLDGILGYSTLSTGWYLTYVRNEGGGIPFDTSSVSESFLQFNDDAAYASPWPQETVCVFLDETGIRFFSWRNPSEVAGIENANVKLLPFDEVYEQMEKLVHLGFAWTDLPEKRSEDFYINRILLTNCLVREKDNTESAFWMPVWLFVYQQESTLDNSVLPGYIAINAIDGSRVQLIE